MTPRRIAGAVWRRYRYASLPRISTLGEIPSHIDENIKAVSLDCFDTLVHRRCDPPEQPLNTWAERVADHLARNGQALTPADIRQRRNLADHSLRQAAADRDHEITLRALHEHLAHEFGTTSTALIELEMACERQVLCPVDGAAEVLQTLRDRGLRIAFVSDMYWDTDLLAELLRDYGFLTDQDVLLVSGPNGATKHRGGLFPLLCQRLDLPASAILHIGDNPIADGISPRKQGLQALWLHDRANLARRQQARAAHGDLAALDRAWPPAEPPAELDADCFRIGRDVLGPAMVLFVLTSLIRIGRSSHSTGAVAGFLARDGWLPLEIARGLENDIPWLKRLLDGVQLSYLHLSRRSCLPAAADDPHILLKSFAEALGVHGTLRALARLLGLDDSDIDSLGADLPLDQPLHQLPDHNDHLHALLALPGIHALIAKRRQESLNALSGYLQDHGVYDQGIPRFHLVDLGWRSTIQSALARAYADDPAMPPVTGHLLGNLLHDRHLSADGRSTLEPGVLVDAHSPTAVDDEIVRAIALMEIGCQAPEGSTLGYEHTDGRWQPRKGPVPAVSEDFRAAVQAGAMARLDQMIPILRDGLITSDSLLPSARAAIVRFVTRPTMSQALAFRKASFDVDIGTTARVPCIDQSLGWRDLLPPQRLLRRIRGVAWVEGSLKASRFPAGRIIHRTWLALRALVRKLRKH